MTTPPDGTVYQASDHRWYRWPDPTPYPTREAADLGFAYVAPAPATPENPFAAPTTPVPTKPVGRETPFAHPPEPSTGVLEATLYAGAVLVGLPIVLGVLGFVFLPRTNSGGCEGIGFGCTPAPSDGALILAGISVFVTVPATAVAGVLIWLLSRLSVTFGGWRPVVRAAAVLGAVGVLFVPALLVRLST